MVHPGGAPATGEIIKMKDAGRRATSKADPL